MLIIAGREEQLHRALHPLMKAVAESVSKDLSEIKSTIDLSSKVKSLREQVEKLEIERARKQEEFDRKEREVEHKIGLERKRQEFEIAQSKREATVAVREENLKADRDRFEQQMKFQQTRFEEEVKYLKDIMGSILKRLPDVNMEIKQGGK